MPTPHYLSTSRGQLRAWLSGTGPPLVAIAGLTMGAAALAGHLSRYCPGRQVIALEPPGIGGSARCAAASLQEAGDAIAQGLAFLGDTPFDLLASEMAAALLPATLAGLRSPPAQVVTIGLDRATAWTAAGIAPSNLDPRDDGTHLNSLWAFLRDRRILEPLDRTQPAASGEPLPGDAELSDTFVAAATAPGRFGENWRLYAEGLATASQLAVVRQLALTADVGEVLDNTTDTGQARGGGLQLPAASPHDHGLWHQYIDTRFGRAHLRRAGSSGRPTLVIPTGGGSSAQFGPVIEGLADTRRVVAIDYFGNGLSAKPVRDVDIAQLAREAVAVLDALGWSEEPVDVWGSHTGACVALDMAISYPERVRKLVLEAPAMVTPAFRDDLLAHYFPDFAPDRFGLHLQRLWHWRRDMFMYWPWYRAEHAATRRLGVPTAEALHLYAVGLLESGASYHGAYRAAFSYDTRARLPYLNRPTLLTAGPNDMLANALNDAARLAPEGVLAICPTPTTMWWPDPEPGAAAQTLALYRDFLG